MEPAWWSEMTPLPVVATFACQLAVTALAAPGARLLASRPPHPSFAPDPALQSVSGGVWGGCVFDTDAILPALGTPPVKESPREKQLG